MASSFTPLKTDDPLVEIHERLGSTNDLAKKLAIQGTSDGQVIVAETQTKGRGRAGRSWHSPPGLNLYLSMVMNIDPYRASLVTLMGAVAVMRSIRRLCPEPELVQIKWPNDVLIQGKKTAGVLGEYLSDKQTWCILGLGVNLNAKEHNLPESPRWPATSVSLHLGKPVDRNSFLSSLVSELRTMKKILVSEPEQILEQIRQSCATIGHEVIVSIRGVDPLQARAIGIQDDGSLLVETSQGTRSVSAGDVDIIHDKRYY